MPSIDDKSKTGYSILFILLTTFIAPICIFSGIHSIKFKIKELTFVNIGGIVNTTTLWNNDNMSGTDIGPGMCLIDKWIRTNSKKKYDVNGDIAKSGKVNEIVLEKYFNYDHLVGHT